MQFFSLIQTKLTANYLINHEMLLKFRRNSRTINLVIAKFHDIKQIYMNSTSLKIISLLERLTTNQYQYIPY